MLNAVKQQHRIIIQLLSLSCTAVAGPVGSWGPLARCNPSLGVGRHMFIPELL